MKECEKVLDIPTVVQLEEELCREKYRIRYKELLKSTISIIVVVVAVSVLVVNLMFQPLRIYGGSMSPTLVNNDIVVCVKKTRFKQGDIIAFYYNNHILVKRIIATSLDFVNIDDSGNVFVNDILLDELYVDVKSYGDVDVEFPFQVEEGAYFVLGDEREVSIDSRNSLIGTVEEEDIIGKIVLRIWPFNRFGLVK